MENYSDPVLEEVRRMKADLINAYGGNEGLRKHIREEYFQLEKNGYKFVTGDELRVRNKNKSAVYVTG